MCAPPTATLSNSSPDRPQARLITGPGSHLVSPPAGRINAVTTTSGHRQRTLLLSPLTMLTLVGATLVAPVDASVSTRPAAQTRVRAIDHPTTAVVGAEQSGSSTTVGVSGLHLRRLVSATGVATEEVANSLNLQSGGAAANTSVGQFGSGEDALSQAAGAADRRGFSAAGRSLTSMVLALARATPCFLEQRAISARSAPWRRGRRATF